MQFIVCLLLIASSGFSRDLISFWMNIYVISDPFINKYTCGEKIKTYLYKHLKKLMRAQIRRRYPFPPLLTSHFSLFSPQRYFSTSHFHPNVTLVLHILRFNRSTVLLTKSERFNNSDPSCMVLHNDANCYIRSPKNKKYNIEVISY